MCSCYTTVLIWPGRGITISSLSVKQREMVREMVRKVYNTHDTSRISRSPMWQRSQRCAVLTSSLHVRDARNRRTKECDSAQAAKGGWGVARRGHRKGGKGKKDGGREEGHRETIVRTRITGCDATCTRVVPSRGDSFDNETQGRSTFHASQEPLPFRRHFYYLRRASLSSGTR